MLRSIQLHRVAAVVLLGTAALAMLNFVRHPAADTEPNLAAILATPHVVVISSAGDRLNAEHLAGRKLIVLCGDPTDPDVATAAKVLSEAVSSLATKSEKFQPVFVSLNPGHTEPEHGASFLRATAPRLAELRAPPQLLVTLLKRWHLAVLNEREQGNAYLSRFYVTPFFAVIGPNGDAQSHIEFTNSPKALANQLVSVL